MYFSSFLFFVRVVSCNLPAVVSFLCSMLCQLFPLLSGWHYFSPFRSLPESSHINPQQLLPSHEPDGQ